MSDEDWTPLKHLISEQWFYGAETLAVGLTATDYVETEKHAELVALLAEHEDCYSEGEHDGRCKCGKWIEYGQYDMPDHLSAVLEEAGLVVEPTPDAITNWQSVVRRVVNRPVMSPEMRDQMAEAICLSTESGRLFPWATLSDVDRDAWRAIADAAIAAQRQACMVETAAELDALPHGSLLVRRYTSEVGWQLHEVWERRNDLWYCLAAPLIPPSQTWGVPRLPAQLVWSPE